VRSGAAGHVTSLKPTFIGRCGPKVQLTWQRVDARSAPCLDLELVCGVPGLQDTDTGHGHLIHDNTLILINNAIYTIISYGIIIHVQYSLKKMIHYIKISYRSI
jgi:hypothetical protein